MLSKCKQEIPVRRYGARISKESKVLICFSWVLKRNRHETLCSALALRFVFSPAPPASTTAHIRNMLLLIFIAFCSIARSFREKKNGTSVWYSKREKRRAILRRVRSPRIESHLNTRWPPSRRRPVIREGVNDINLWTNVMKFQNILVREAGSLPLTIFRAPFRGSNILAAWTKTKSDKLKIKLGSERATLSQCHHDCRRSVRDPIEYNKVFNEHWKINWPLWNRH